MRPETAERWLRRLLYVMGGVALLAVVPLVMPTDWMETINDRLGLGPFQRSPLMEYLTRSLSAVYAMFGAMAVFVAPRVRRYLDLVVFMGWLTVLLGVALLSIDLYAGMPPSWTWGEGVPTMVLGGVFVWLGKRARAA